MHIDQQSLLNIMEQHQKWLTKLIRCDFEVQYKLGSKNKAANVLSRMGDRVELIALSYIKVLDLSILGKEIEKDPVLSKLKVKMEGSRSTTQRYSVEQGLSKNKGCLVVPCRFELKQKVLEEFHNSKVRRYSGVLKIYKRLVVEVYQSGMVCNVCHFVASCDVFQ